MTFKTQPKLLRRSLAAIIDYGIFIAFFVWFVSTYGDPNEEGGYSIHGLKGAWIEIFWLCYFPILESLTGQTLGKKILGLKVVAISGREISFWQALKRHLLDIFDFFCFGIIAFIAIKNTPAHQRLGDLWAKTIVIGGDEFTCTNCREKLTLTANEIIENTFVCPCCGTTMAI